MGVTSEFLMSGRERELREAFLRQVDLIPDGRKLQQCIQCGTCTGSCPVSYAMDVTPRKAMALVRAGEIETILRSRTIWLCTSCYACTVRCPAGIKITEIMYAFKRLAMAKKIYPKAFPVHVLSSAFVEMVNRHGRNQEMRLLARYGLRTKFRDLVGSIPLALRLRLKGRLPVTSGHVKDRKELAGLVDRVLR
jgi:heterodisulfide reductase subunit C